MIILEKQIFLFFKNIQIKSPPQDISKYQAWHVAIGDNLSRMRID